MTATVAMPLKTITKGFFDAAFAEAMRKHGGPECVLKDAGISQDGQYRYWLKREWASPSNHPRLPIIMLNPSKADASVDDPTIRRCMAFARREGYGGIQVVNLFSFRTKDPKIMWGKGAAGVDIVGPHTDNHIRKMAEHSALIGYPAVLCAWGADEKAWPRAKEVMKILAPGTTVCLGLTKGGAPRHPLCVHSDTPLETFTL
jgi:hypothetical protein